MRRQYRGVRHYHRDVTTPERITHWIGGAPYDGTSGRTVAGAQPRDREVTGAVALASEADVEQAVATAKEAAAELAAARRCPSAPACCSRSARSCTTAPTSSRR